MVEWESLAEKPGFIYRVLDGRIHLWSILPVYEKDGRYVMRFYTSEKVPFKSPVLDQFTGNSKKLYKIVRKKLKHYKRIDADYGISKPDEGKNVIYDYGEVPEISAPKKQMKHYMLSFKEYKEIEGFIDRYYGIFKSKCEGARFKQDFFDQYFWDVYWENFEEGKGHAKAILIGTLGRFSKTMDYNNEILEQLTRAVQVDVVGAKRMFWSRFWKAIKEGKERGKAEAEAYFHTLGHYTVRIKDKTTSDVVADYVNDSVGRLTRHRNEKRAIRTLAVLMVLSKNPDDISALGTPGIAHKADKEFKREWKRLGI